MSEPRQAKGWPLVAIIVLTLLLAGFLVVTLRKRDEAPLLVKESPPPRVEAPAPAPPPVAPPPAPVVPPPQQEAAAIEAARKAEEEKVRQAELKAKQLKEWAALKEQIEKEKGENRWDACLKALEKFAADWPGAAQDTEFESQLRGIREYQADADKVYQKAMADAEKSFAAGQFSQAILQAESSLKLYPERKAAVREFQDRARARRDELTMVRIPAQPCWIGSDDREDEKPARQVTLPAFLIDTYEVTNEEYHAFVVATECAYPPYWLGRRIPKGKERHPVVYVTWEDARAYAAWAGKRLPSAEEWEVAARGPDRRDYPWGNVFAEKENVFPCNCLEFWQVNKGKGPPIPFTTPVDQFDGANGASPWGVQGMGGNVWEWTTTEIARKEKDDRPPFRVLKGGSFMTPQPALRSANVFAEDPRLAHPDVGFRCVRDLK